MIYYITNTLTKKKTIIVKSINELPLDSSHQISNIVFYHIKDSVFADIITLPTDSTDPDADLKKIIEYNFQDSDVKTFENKDTFQAYIIYENI